ncbi:RNA-directed DNA polymerase, eukaryota [Tanacetum coccineum]
MFYNYLKSWNVGELWRVFKGYGTVFDIYMVKKTLRSGQKYGFVRFKNNMDVDFLYKRLCSISFFGKQRLVVFHAHDRKIGDNHISKPKNGNDLQKIRTGISKRDARRYIDALRGMSKVVCEANKNTGGEKEEEESEETTKDYRELVITKDDMVGDVIWRGFIGEVKDAEFIGKLLEFCSMEGIFNVEVKYMGVIEGMMILELEEAVKNVIENTNHEEIRDIVQFNILDPMGKPIEEDEVIVEDTKVEGESLVGDVEPANSGPLDMLDDDEDDEMVEETMEVGGAHDGDGGGEHDRDGNGERVEDHESRLQLSRKSNDENGGMEKNDNDVTFSKGVGNEEEQDLASANLNEKVVDKEFNASRHRKFRNSGPDMDREGIRNLGQKDESGNKSVGPSFMFHRSKVNTQNLENRPKNYCDTPRIVVNYANTLKHDNCNKNNLDFKGADEKQESQHKGSGGDFQCGECSIIGKKIQDVSKMVIRGGVCSFNNMRKIGEQIGVVRDEVDQPPVEIVSLNIRGLERKGKVRWIKDIIRAEKLCVLGLQETKWERFIMVKGSWKGVEGKVVLANIYGFHVTDKKVELWNRISGLMDSVGGGWCLFGDFNDVRESNDRINLDFKVIDVNFFNDFIRKNSMIEIQLGNQRYTRIIDDGLKFSKLDRFFVTSEFMEK